MGDLGALYRCALALAGFPLTSGFFAKFGVIAAALDAHSYALAIVAMATAVISAFVYLRVIVAMYMADEDDEAEARPREPLPFSAGLGIALLPIFRCLEELRSHRLAQVLDGWHAPVTPIHAVYPSTRHLSPKVKSFVDHLQAQMSPPPWELGPPP